MAIGVVRLIAKVIMRRLGQTMGPFDYDISSSIDEAASINYEIATATTVQLIGGASPEISGIATVNFLLLQADQDILVAFQGADPAVSGWTISADKVAILGPGVTITEVQVRNNSGSTTNLTVLVEGT